MSPEEAGGRAAARIRRPAPTCGRSERGIPIGAPNILRIRPGVRTVTKEKFIFYFEINETEFEVMIFAVFSEEKITDEES